MKEILYQKVASRIQANLSNEDYLKVDLILKDVLLDECLMGPNKSMAALNEAFTQVFGQSVIKTGAKHSQRRGEEGAASMLFVYICRKAGYKLVHLANFLEMNHTSIIYMHQQYIDRIYIGDYLTVGVYEKWNNYLKSKTAAVTIADNNGTI